MPGAVQHDSGIAEEAVRCGNRQGIVEVRVSGLEVAVIARHQPQVAEQPRTEAELAEVARDREGRFDMGGAGEVCFTCTKGLAYTVPATLIAGRAASRT